MIEINSGPTITILSDVFFTHLVCHLSLDDLSDGPIPDMSQFDTFITNLAHWKQWKYKYMTKKVLIMSYLEKQLFKKIATVNDTRSK
jgi:hypothetical protein